MAGPSTAILIGKWSIGFLASDNMTILTFEFADRPTLTLALPLDQATQIAAAIQDQLRSPPTSNQMN